MVEGESLILPIAPGSNWLRSKNYRTSYAMLLTGSSSWNVLVYTCWILLDHIGVCQSCQCM